MRRGWCASPPNGSAASVSDRLWVLLAVAVGLSGAILPAFGWLGVDPVFTLRPWVDLFAWPGLAASIALTLRTGLLGTALALLLALVLLAAARRPGWAAMMRLGIGPVLAVPHAAMALGLAFLVAPSGWIARLIAPAFGWTVPPDIATVQDHQGIGLIAGLVLKETPFLLLVGLAALGPLRAERPLAAAAALGHGPFRAWLLVVLPLLWPRLRLPVLAVLAFSLSVVDMAVVLGPGAPPSLAVQIVRWQADPDFARWGMAGAASLLLVGLVAGCAGLGWAAERAVAAVGGALIRSGRRGGDGRAADVAARIGGLGLTVLALASLAGLALWSVTESWRFPAPLPQALGLRGWRGVAILPPGWTTLWLGVASTGLAVLLSVAALAARVRLTPAVLVPLLLPQVAIVFGMHILLLRLDLDASTAGLLGAHLLFVLPYTYLVLAPSWQALDARFGRAARCLGIPPWRVTLRIVLPLLSRPLLAAAAIGFAVSAAEYLPTLVVGAGRTATLTTEAVALASGGDRRIASAMALAQAVLPLLGFGLAARLSRARR